MLVANALVDEVDGTGMGSGESKWRGLLTIELVRLRVWCAGSTRTEAVAAGGFAVSVVVAPIVVPWSNSAGLTPPSPKVMTTSTPTTEDELTSPERLPERVGSANMDREGRDRVDRFFRF